MALSTTDQLLLAAQVAARAHAGHKRKDGTPYFTHPVRVAIRAASSVSHFVNPGEGLDLLVQTVALLHDTVEDTSVTLQELREFGFSPDVIEAVDRLTRRTGETYADFIQRCAGNVVSKQVKIADIEDNLADQSALDPEEAEFLRNRYTKALEALSD